MYSHFKFLVVGDLSRIETCDRTVTSIPWVRPVSLTASLTASHVHSHPPAGCRFGTGHLKFSRGHAALTFSEQAL